MYTIWNTCNYKLNTIFCVWPSRLVLQHRLEAALSDQHPCIESVLKMFWYGLKYSWSCIFYFDLDQMHVAPSMAGSKAVLHVQQWDPGSHVCMHSPLLLSHSLILLCNYPHTWVSWKHKLRRYLTGTSSHLLSCITVQSVTTTTATGEWPLRVAAHLLTVVSACSALTDNRSY